MPREHVIQEGESTISLSAEYGFLANTIWDDPANAALKTRRKDMNVLFPGDTLVIPDKRFKDVTGPSEKGIVFEEKAFRQNSGFSSSRPIRRGPILPQKHPPYPPGSGGQSGSIFRTHRDHCPQARRYVQDHECGLLDSLGAD